MQPLEDGSLVSIDCRKKWHIMLFTSNKCLVMLHSNQHPTSGFAKGAVVSMVNSIRKLPFVTCCRCGTHLASYEDGLKGRTDTSKKLVKHNQVAREGFTSNKLAPKLAQQLKVTLAHHRVYQRLHFNAFLTTSGQRGFIVIADTVALLLCSRRYPAQQLFRLWCHPAPVLAVKFL